MDENRCFKCEKADTEVRLYKCPVCHKYFCDEHAYRKSGVSFCTRGCGEYFFFGDPED